MSERKKLQQINEILITRNILVYKKLKSSWFKYNVINIKTGKVIDDYSKLDYIINDYNL